MPEPRPSLLVVVQRYGDVAGGAEAHARQVVRRLRGELDVEVATTTARDYWTWENELTAGEDDDEGVRVLRFPVERGRSRFFRRYESAAFAGGHTLRDEHAFVAAQGPVAPELLDHIWRRGREVDHVLFFTYIYYPTVYGLPLVPERAVLVPTAHDEPAIGLTVYKPVFHAPRAFAFNTEEERAMVHRRFANARIPNEIVGVGVDVPEGIDPARFRERYEIEGPYLLYLGRIVESKGCPELFDHFAGWSGTGPARPATLVLAGHAEMAIPQREDVRYLGTISDEEKFDALAGATALVVPSLLESLSMVTLESWAVGRPVVCSARSPVLASMARRAGGGLPYRNAAEFGGILDLLLEEPETAARLGASGRAFVEATYTWPAVVRKYLDLFAEVRARNA
ncbi:MAG TPA: glycosyltransferase family 4 protein [Candidatus Limnocylindrales bacterium]|nr:glycosyltransferase family 4 protein [Candidatus Limnocylindrales bacterium]